VRLNPERFGRDINHLYQEVAPSAKPDAAPRVIGRFPGETSCISIVWAVLDRASRGWRGLTMTPAGLRLLQDLCRSLLEPPRQLRPRPTPTRRTSDRPEPASA
jgi:putative transposase